MAISASEARKNLYGLIKQVSEDADVVEIVSKNGNAVLVSADEWRSLQETAHLLRSPANAERLLESIAAVETGISLRTYDSLEAATAAAGPTTIASPTKRAPGKAAVLPQPSAEESKPTTGRKRVAKGLGNAVTGRSTRAR